MGSPALVYPAMAQLLWTLVLITWNGSLRVRAIRARRVRMADIALSAEAYPEHVRKVSNNMHNQLETPIVFYALVGIATFIGATGWAMMALAWLYVGTRVVHTAIHTTTNYVPYRFYAFLAGVLTLIAMWVGVALKLAQS